MRQSSPGEPTGGQRPLLTALALATLISGVVALTVVAYAVFPAELPLPVPPAPRPAARRLTAALPLLPLLPSAELELSRLGAAYAAVRSLTRSIPLPAIAGIRGPRRKLALAVPLGLVPGSAADADHEVRHALLLPSPGKVRWSIRLPHRAQLVFGTACLQGPAALLELRVRGVTGAEERRAWQIRPARSFAAASWREHQLDLSALSGEMVELELRSSTLGSAGFANLLVANPIVLGEPGAKQRANVLFINIDSTQAAATGPGGDTYGTTPNIDRLAREGVSFVRAYAATNWTRPSNLAFLTGRLPSEQGLKMVMIPTLEEERRSYYLSGTVALPLHLSRLGYLTKAIVQNNVLEDVWGTGVDVGFQEYHYVTETIDHGVKITRAAIDFIERHRAQTWFLYLSYNQPHWPYRPFREALARGQMARDNPLDWAYSLYRGEVNTADGYIAPLLQTLTNLGFERETLVVFNSDHGEQLRRDHAQEIIRESIWEAGVDEHVRTYSGHETAFDEALRVPLVLRWPSVLPAGRRVDLPVALYDLPPTLLELLGLPPLPPTRGRSLVPTIRGQAQTAVPLLLEPKSIRVVVDWPYKYIRRDGVHQWMRYFARGEPLHPVPEELFDLVRDPLETHDLAPAQPALLARLRQTLAALRPKPRFVYFFSARGGTGAYRLRLHPASALAQVHLLEDDGPSDLQDRLERTEDAATFTFHVGPDDLDRLAFTTSSREARVTLSLEQLEPAAPRDTLIRVGGLRLPQHETTLITSDDDTVQQWDSDRDPDDKPGLYCWRIPIVGGVRSRGGKLEDTVQETFRSWGYVK